MILQLVRVTEVSSGEDCQQILKKKPQKPALVLPCAESPLLGEVRKDLRSAQRF